MERSECGPCRKGARACTNETCLRPPCRSESSGGLTLCRADRPVRGVKPRSPRVLIRPPPPLHPLITNPSLQQVTELHKLHKVTATRKTCRPKNPEPKTLAATKPASGKVKKKAAANVKTAADKPTTQDLLVPRQSSTSPLEKIPGLHDHLHLKHVWT